MEVTVHLKCIAKRKNAVQPIPLYLDRAPGTVRELIAGTVQDCAVCGRPEDQGPVYHKTDTVNAQIRHQKFTETYTRHTQGPEIYHIMGTE